MSVGAMILFFGIVFVAAVVQGLSGFAFSMIVLMVFPYLFGYTNALALADLMAVVLLLYNSYLYRKHCTWKWIPVGFLAFAVGNVIGVTVLKRVGDNPIWYTLMGVLFVVMSIYLLWGQKRLSFKANYKSLAFFAALCGLVVGAFSVGGPLMAAFFLQAAKSKENYLGSIQIFSLFTMLFDVIVRALNGMYNLQILEFTGLGIVFMIAGLLIARVLVRHMNALTLRKIICLVMFVNGIVMFFHN